MSWWRSLAELVRDVAQPERRRERRGLAPDRPPPPAVPPEASQGDPAVLAQVSAARQAVREGDAAAAAAAAQEALAHAPGDLFAAFYRGCALARAGDADGARDAFAEARRNDPFGLVDDWVQRLADDPDVLAAVDLPEEPAPEQPEPAPEEPAAALPETPAPQADEAMALEQAARAALREEDPERAVELARQAVARDPANLLAHHHLGRALLALGRRDEARQAYLAARPYDRGMGLVDEWLRGLEG